MTLEDFKKHAFGAGEKVSYKGIVYPIVSVDFVECLIAIDKYDDPDDLSWVRCESVTLAV